MISSDILSLEDYFEGFVSEDPILKTFVLETSNNPYEMERLNSLSRTDSFQYPALVMFMPLISGGDTFSHDFTAIQELAFACMYSAEDNHTDMVNKYRMAQLDAWRIIKYLRRDHKAGKLRLEGLHYKMVPMEYGNDNCVGYYVIISITTSTNYLIGS